MGFLLHAHQKNGVHARLRVGGGARRRVVEIRRLQRVRSSEERGRRVLPRRDRRAEFVGHLADGDEFLFAAGAVAAGERRVLYREAARAGVLEFADGSHRVERVAVAVVGVHDLADVGGAGDAAHLPGEFRERHHREVGRAEDHGACDGAAEHSHLEAERVGDARRDGVEDGCGARAFVAFEVGAQAASAVGGQHRDVSYATAGRCAVATAAGGLR